MKQPFTAVVTLLFLQMHVSVAHTQSNGDGLLSDTNSVTEITKTPDMWFYTEAWRRHDDTDNAVRRNAENRAEERRHRIATRKWYGYSNSRPQASSVPWMGTYSSIWSSNRTDPFLWTPRSPSGIFIGSLPETFWR